MTHKLTHIYMIHKNLHIHILSYRHNDLLDTITSCFVYKTTLPWRNIEYQANHKENCTFISLFGEKSSEARIRSCGIVCWHCGIWRQINKRHNADHTCKWDETEYASATRCTSFWVPRNPIQSCQPVVSVKNNVCNFRWNKRVQNKKKKISEPNFHPVQSCTTVRCPCIL